MTYQPLAIEKKPVPQYTRKIDKSIFIIHTQLCIFFFSPPPPSHIWKLQIAIYCLKMLPPPPPFTHNSQLILFRSIVYLGEIWAGCQCFVIYSMSTLGNSERIRADGKKIKGKEISVFSFFLYYSSSSGQS